MEEAGSAAEPVKRKPRIHPVWGMCIEWYQTKSPAVVRKVGNSKPIQLYLRFRLNFEL